MLPVLIAYQPTFTEDNPLFNIILNSIIKVENIKRLFFNMSNMNNNLLKIHNIAIGPTLCKTFEWFN